MFAEGRKSDEHASLYDGGRRPPDETGQHPQPLRLYAHRIGVPDGRAVRLRFCAVYDAQGQRGLLHRRAGPSPGRRGARGHARRDGALHQAQRPPALYADRRIPGQQPRKRDLRRPHAGRPDLHGHLLPDHARLPRLQGHPGRHARGYDPGGRAGRERLLQGRSARPGHRGGRLHLPGPARGAHALGLHQEPPPGRQGLRLRAAGPGEDGSLLGPHALAQDLPGLHRARGGGPRLLRGPARGRRGHPLRGHGLCGRRPHLRRDDGLHLRQGQPRALQLRDDRPPDRAGQGQQPEVCGGRLPHVRLGRGRLPVLRPQLPPRADRTGGLRLPRL